ncbi:hypothetical protein L0337_46055 [candidate division KSB1 bacterium]|nr:hypothetical protein [candidate division KSB1 bacterium]
MLAKSATALMISACLTAGFLFSSCDEELPPYQPPQNALRAAFGVLDGVTNRFVSCNVNTRVWNLDPIVFEIGVINTFDETLQGPADRVSGKLEIWRAEDSVFGKLIAFTGVFDSRHVQGNTLTLNPGDTLEVGVTWRHDNDANQRIWRQAAARPFNATIHARGQIKVFEDAPVLLLPEIKLQVVYDVDVNVPVCDQ